MTCALPLACARGACDDGALRLCLEEPRSAPPAIAQVDFLLATKPLSALARVRNEADWDALLYETQAPLD